MSTLAGLVGGNLGPVSVEEYHRMVERGILKPGDRVELIEGRLVNMTPVEPGQTTQVDKLKTNVGDAAKSYNQRHKDRNEQVVVRQEAPLVLDRSVPQPDVALVRANADNDLPIAESYLERHPTAKEAYLVIEISDTTLRLDRQKKLPIYAASGVPEVWIVDMDSRDVTVHRAPVNGKYEEESTVKSGAISPLLIPDLHLTVEDFLVVQSRARGSAARHKVNK